MKIKVDHPATRDSRHGVVTVTRRVVSQNGLLGLYRGYTMGATREGESMGVELNWKWGWHVERMYRRYFSMTCWLLTVQFVESHCWSIIYHHYHSYIIYNQSYTYNIIFTIQYGQTFVLEGFSHQFAPALVPFFNAGRFMAFTGIFCSSYMAINPMVKSELQKQDLDTWCYQVFFSLRSWEVDGLNMRGGNDRDCCAGVLRGWSRWSWFVGYAASIWIAGDICASVALSTTMTIRDIRISYLAGSSWVLLVSSHVWEDEKMTTYYEHDDVNFFVPGTAMMFANCTKEISDNTATLISSATWPKRSLHISGRGSTSYYRLIYVFQNKTKSWGYTWLHLIPFDYPIGTGSIHQWKDRSFEPSRCFRALWAQLYHIQQIPWRPACKQE